MLVEYKKSTPVLNYLDQCQNQLNVLAAESKRAPESVNGEQLTLVVNGLSQVLQRPPYHFVYQAKGRKDVQLQFREIEHCLLSLDHEKIKEIRAAIIRLSLRIFKLPKHDLEFLNRFGYHNASIEKGLTDELIKEIALFLHDGFHWFRGRDNDLNLLDDSSRRRIEHSLRWMNEYLRIAFDLLSDSDKIKINVNRERLLVLIGKLLPKEICLPPQYLAMAATMMYKDAYLKVSELTWYHPRSRYLTLAKWVVNNHISLKKLAGFCRETKSIEPLLEYEGVKGWSLPDADCEDVKKVVAENPSKKGQILAAWIRFHKKPLCELKLNQEELEELQPKLEYVNLTNFPLPDADADIQKFVAGFKNAKVLILHNPIITALPELSHLTSLYIYDCFSLAVLPNNLNHLQILTCRKSGLRALPDNLVNLQRLDCNDSVKLTTLPTGMKNLLDLRCQGTSIATLPYDLEKLEDLDCSQCSYLKEFPFGMANLRRIRCVWCPLLSQIPIGLVKLETFICDEAIVHKIISPLPPDLPKEFVIRNHYDRIIYPISVFPR